MIQRSSNLILAATLSLCLVSGAQEPARPRYWRSGQPRSAAEFPDGPFRRNLEALPVGERAHALSWLSGVNIPEADLPALRLARNGAVYYACDCGRDHGAAAASAPAPAASESGPVIAAAAIPISPFPASLIFHSRPGAANVIFLDFDGANVTGTQWNTDLGRTLIDAIPYSSNADYTTYADDEQLTIKRIWMRVAEDYAPFDVDVTTEAPATFTTRTCHVILTHSTNFDGVTNPSSTAGGVAFVNVFNLPNYAFYRPAWVYPNNLGPYREDLIAEAASHEAGHNLGLSHDGTSASGYYGGHGSGDTSWGPIMGASYNRNVTQWSKGEYFDANNTEDDLAIVAGKLGYRADDIGNTSASPRPLTVTGGTQVLATTVDADPANASPGNKGILERNTDVDVWSFNSGAGTLNLRVDPFVSPANARGGNLDLVVELRDSAGALVGSYNPAANTHALINATVPAGLYFLHVSGAGVGAPTVSPPTGFTSYGTIGRYFISGTIPNNSGVVTPPRAAAVPGDLTDVEVPAHPFTVTYSDDLGVDTATLDGADIRVTGPGGYNRLATFVSVDNATDGTPRVATYSAPAPNGVAWLPADNGAYTVALEAGQVGDVEGAFAAAATLGAFQAAVPVALYSASMTTNPGWTFTGPTSNGWAYGDPTGTSGDPQTGHTGTNVIGYNLNGNYGNNLATCYATTPAFSCASSSAVTLRYRRWLGLRANDSAGLQLSTDGANWSTVWSTTANAQDTAWQLVTHDLSALAAGHPSVRLRWSLGSNASQTRCGWNIDDVFVLGGGTPPDSTPPTAALETNGILLAGAPSHSFLVTYADDTAVAVASLDGADLTVAGPNGFLASATFAGVDETVDGTPRLASYSLPAPGGSWDPADNGVYTVSLADQEVSDTVGNDAPAAVLGSFTVDIPLHSLTTTVLPAGTGSVSPSNGLRAAGTTLILTATPAPYHLFAGWSGDRVSTNQVLETLVLSNLVLTAHFAPLVTIQESIPLVWLAEQGVTNDFESAVLTLGANGLPLWQSYVAGLNPDDPSSVLRLDEPSVTDLDGAAHLAWPTVEGRVYSLLSAPGPAGPFVPLAGATNLPWTVRAHTDTGHADAPGRVYRLEVRLESGSPD